MTNVEIYRDKNKNIVKAIFDGHAEHSNENDIVCSAISAVSYMTLNTLESVLKINVGYQTGDGYLFFVLPDDLTDDMKDKANIVLEGMYLFLNDLKEQYRDNVSISELEV